jgi:hypothetical protein
MPTGQSSWARRLVGLARSQQLLRRVLALQGDAVLAPLISRPSPMPIAAEGSGGMPQAVVVSFRQWAAKLSQPLIVLLVEDDHAIIQEDTQVIASDSLVGSRWGGSVGEAIS